MNRCDWFVDPFAYDDEKAMCCKPAQPQEFVSRDRMRFSIGYRCEEHWGWCNDLWLVADGPTPALQLECMLAAAGFGWWAWHLMTGRDYPTSSVQ